MFQGKKRLVVLASAISALGIVALATALAFGYVGGAHAAAPDDQISAAGLASAHAHFSTVPPSPHAKQNRQCTNTSAICSFDTLQSFSGQYSVPGLDPSGNPNSNWIFNTAGSPPQLGGTTEVHAPIIPVAIDLRNFDGTPRFATNQFGQSVRLFFDPQHFVQPVLDSPVFSDAKYSSGDQPTQITDAIQRAEYNSVMKQNWHTTLRPDVKTQRTMVLNRGTYRFAFNADGTCCAFVLVDDQVFTAELFPPTFPVDNTTIIGSAELAGDMTTKDITTFLFPNTYLFLNHNPADCCVLGFHSFDFEPGATSSDPLRAYVMDYSSWISPGLFNGGFQDVTALSHEMAELYNDPFVTGIDGVSDVTPWWVSGGNCQDDLETGDVIEGLSNATFPIAMRTHGNQTFTYHPQNEALLQWFESGGAPFPALDNAFSYPDETVLTSPNVSQNVTFDSHGNPTCTGPLT